jgi:hypothetical protein
MNFNGEIMIKKSVEVNPVNTYSFRAECREDALYFLALLEATSLKKIMIIPDPTFPDVEVEIETKLTVKDISSALKMVEDGHVMVETLKVCALKSNGMDSDPYC